MGHNTDELTTTPEDIRATRADLSRDIDELSDKVSPQRVVERRKQAAIDSIGSVREKIMGSGGNAGDSASGAASSAKQTAQSAVGSLGSATDGNPLVAGLVAFGAGMLIASLLPASAKEAQAASKLVDVAKEHGQPLLEEAKATGQEVAKDLGNSASEAAEKVKAQAQDSAAAVKDEGQSSVTEVKDQASPSTA